jgi:hypothetical protein
MSYCSTTPTATGRNPFAVQIKKNNLYRRRTAAVDLALVRTSELIQGTVAALPPPGFKPRGTVIFAIRREATIHLVFESGCAILRVGHIRM